MSSPRASSCYTMVYQTTPANRKETFFFYINLFSFGRAANPVFFGWVCFQLPQGRQLDLWGRILVIRESRYLRKCSLPLYFLRHVPPGPWTHYIHQGLQGRIRKLILPPIGRIRHHQLQLQKCNTVCLRIITIFK